MKNYRKLVGTLLGGVTGGVIIAALAVFGVVVPVALAATIAGAVSAIGAYLAKPNEDA